MRQIPLLFLLFLLTFFACACANSSFPGGNTSSTLPESSSVSSQVPPSSPAPSSPSSASEEAPEPLPDPALSKAPIVGAFRKDVDFLTEEQWLLYDRGLIHLFHFIFDPGDILEDRNTAGAGGKMIDGWKYYPYYSEKYPNYDAFYQDMLTIYTPEFFEVLNHTMTPRLNEPSPPIYLNVDGGLYYLDCTGSANLTHLRNWDRYELESKDEDRIEFDVIAYYCEHDDVSLENPVPVKIQRGSVVMEKTSGGWRISKFDYPN